MRAALQVVMPGLGPGIRGTSPAMTGAGSRTAKAGIPPLSPPYLA